MRKFDDKLSCDEKERALQLRIKYIGRSFAERVSTPEPDIKKHYVRSKTFDEALSEEDKERAHQLRIKFKIEDFFKSIPDFEKEMLREECLEMIDKKNNYFAYKLLEQRPVDDIIKDERVYDIIERRFENEKNK